jgi:undecaprenyl-diphosphatase
MPLSVQAALLGVVQGLTEFLPVSSSAHLILARMFFGFDSDKFGLPFDVATHVGTLVAVIVYFHRDLLAIIGSIPFLLRPDRAGTGDNVSIEQPDVQRGGEGARLIWLLVVGSIPIAVVGLFFTEAVEQRVRTPHVAATMLATGALLLFIAERMGSKGRNQESLTMAEAFWIGCAQATALVPGVSRSGASITVALMIGLGRAEAARFTFLLGIAAVVGAAALKFPDMLAEGLGGNGAMLFAVGTASSAIVGYLAVKYFIRFVARHSLDAFAWYRLALAGSVLVWLLAGRGV